MPSHQGKVYLVGAGPGDPGLLTIKAQAILRQAEVVIYDYLANPVLLEEAPPEAELINAGKRHGQHTIPQEQISALIVQKAQAGKIVVRLKGGDPFIFGRGGEELEAVVQAGIPFEVVPGVSSVNGVPAYAGVPLTHRDYSSNVVFLTGTEHPEKPQTMIPWPAIAQIGTIVVLMARASLEGITRRLIEAGRAPETPVVVVQWGSWPAQRSLKASLADVAMEVLRQQFMAPILTIIGEVGHFYEHFNWFERQPLFGQSILVTRAETETSSLAEALRALGANVQAYPTSEIRPPTSWEAFDQAVQIAEQMAWVIFTSVNGIQHTMARLAMLGKDSRVFGRSRVACVGAATARALQRYGLQADLVPQHFQSEGLLEAFKTYEIRGQNLWLPQAEVTRETLRQGLSAQGAILHLTPVYRNELPEVDWSPFVADLEAGKIDWLTFTSASTVKNFFLLLPERGKVALQARSPQVACIGQITAAAAREQGLEVTVMPQQQDLEGLIAALCEACASFHSP